MINYLLLEIAIAFHHLSIMRSIFLLKNNILLKMNLRNDPHKSKILIKFG